MMLSMLVPVYNGASFLEPCIEELTRWQSEEARTSEIIVCEDGSTDGTKQLCGVLKARYPSVRFIHEDMRLGRGGALRRAALSAHGDVLVYVDVDMASDPRFLDRVIGEAMNGSDVVTGSRYLSQSRSTRSFMRFACSKAYNLLVRVLFRSPIRDHQCGFKAFRREVLREVLPTGHRIARAGHETGIPSHRSPDRLVRMRRRNDGPTAGRHPLLPSGSPVPLEGVPIPQGFLAFRPVHRSR